MREVLTVLAVVLVVATVRAQTGEPATVKVKAWMKSPAKATVFDTSTLAGLKDFHPENVDLDTYGGWKVPGTPAKATGFFYAQQIDGRWWLIDPEGNRFLHMAVVSVGVQHGPGFKAALAAKFGGSRDQWLAATMALLTNAGFNGTGAWSDDALLQASPRRLVYTPILNLMSGYGHKHGGMRQDPGHAGYPGDCIFSFDPGFAAYADQACQSLAQHKDDPWLLGYFSDNELPLWKGTLTAFLKLPESEPGHAAAAQWKAARPGGAAAPITPADEDAFRIFVAERYFSICRAAIHKYDPHHMYIGSRFHSGEKKSEKFIAAAGKYLDVVSINVYGNWNPREDAANWARWAGKPMIPTEWYAKGMDSGMKNDTGAGWTVPTQKDRGYFYQHFVLQMLASKGAVGWHWFKYADNDPLDTSADPSNRDSNKGIVNGKYEPYEPLREAMTALNKVAYPLTAYFDRKP